MIQQFEGYRAPYRLMDSIDYASVQKNAIECLDFFSWFFSNSWIFWNTCVGVFLGLQLRQNRSVFSRTFFGEEIASFLLVELVSLHFNLHGWTVILVEILYIRQWITVRMSLAYFEVGPLLASYGYINQSPGAVRPFFACVLLQVYCFSPWLSCWLPLPSGSLVLDGSWLEYAC